MEELLPTLQTDLLPKLKGKKNDRKRAWFGVSYNVALQRCVKMNGLISLLFFFFLFLFLMGGIWGCLKEFLSFLGKKVSALHLPNLTGTRTNLNRVVLAI